MFQKTKAHERGKALLCECLIFKLKENCFRNALNQRKNDCNPYEMFLRNAQRHYTEILKALFQIDKKDIFAVSLQVLDIMSI